MVKLFIRIWKQLESGGKHLNRIWKRNFKVVRILFIIVRRIKFNQGKIGKIGFVCEKIPFTTYRKNDVIQYLKRKIEFVVSKGLI